MENFGKFMVIVLAMIISPIINGFVIMKLWGWFIVTTFDLPPLRVVEAIGIAFLINYVRAKRSKDANNDNFWSGFTLNVIFVLLHSGFALLSGWIVKSFM
jgi:hypothetical protein